MQLLDPRSSAGAAINPGRLFVAMTSHALSPAALAQWSGGYIPETTIPAFALPDPARHLYVFEVERPWSTVDAYAWFLFSQGATVETRSNFWVAIFDAEEQRSLWETNRTGTAMLDALRTVPGGLQNALAGVAKIIAASGEAMREMGEAAETTARYLPFIIAGLGVLGLIFVIGTLAKGTT